MNHRPQHMQTRRVLFPADYEIDPSRHRPSAFRHVATQHEPADPESLNASRRTPLSLRSSRCSPAKYPFFLPFPRCLVSSRRHCASRTMRPSRPPPRLRRRRPHESGSSPVKVDGVKSNAEPKMLDFCAFIVAGSDKLPAKCGGHS